MGAQDRLLGDLASGEAGADAGPEHSQRLLGEGPPHSSSSNSSNAWAPLQWGESGVPGAAWGGAGSFKGALRSVALGQVLSLLVTVTAVSSSVLASQGVSIPASQSFLNYLLLAAAYGTPLLLRAWRGRRTPLPPSHADPAPAPPPLPQCAPESTEASARNHSNNNSGSHGRAHLCSASGGSAGGWVQGLGGPTLALFALTSLLDVEGNYLVVLAFRYTSLTSVALLDCWAIPCAMLLTSHFLGAGYTPRHTLGALLCTGGLACLLFSDAHAEDRAQAGPAPGLGDALVLLGASLYAGSNVLVEHLSSAWTPREVLGALGCGGSVLSLAQLLVLERHELSQYALSPATLLPLLAFSLALFAFYSLVPLMLRQGGAAFFNLSLLTSDAWAVGISALWFHKYVGPLYFVALAAVAAGLSLYSLGSAPTTAPPSPTGPVGSPRAEE